MTNEWFLDFITGISLIVLITSIVAFTYRIGHMTEQNNFEDNYGNTCSENAKKQNRNYR